MKRIILIILAIVAFGIDINATNTTITNVDVETPSGNLNINIEKNDQGVYDLLITETSELVSNASMTEFPFKDSRKAFDREFKNSLVTSLKLTYPDICELISSGKIFNFSASINFDDKREAISKRFWINAKAHDLQTIVQVMERITTDESLLNMIKQVAEQVYRNVPVKPRILLPDHIRFQIENGHLGYFSNAYAKVEKGDLIM